MKILILGTARSGTTSLANAFSEQDYHTLIEPYNLVYRNHPYPLEELSYSKLCVKSIGVQRPKNILLNEIIEWQLEFIQDFDKLILLDRRNESEHMESFVHLHWRLRNREGVMQNWTSDIIPNWYKIKNKLKFEYDFKEMKDHIKKISELTNTDITYYEDLYSDDRVKAFDIINKWSIKHIDPFEVLEYLDPSKKLKKNTKLF